MSTPVLPTTVKDALARIGCDSIEDYAHETGNDDLLPDERELLEPLLIRDAQDFVRWIWS